MKTDRCNHSKDLYSNYKELKKYEKINEDYRIVYKIRKKTDVALFAIHGGGIERYTDIIARDIAGKEYSYYLFIGMKKNNNSVLHITSTCFDEPNALKVAKKSDIIVSIHGCKSQNPIVHVGGLNIALIQKISENLKESGFNIGDCKNTEISGNNPDNICNKCKTHHGVQIEISSELRNKFYQEGRESAIYKSFISAIQKALIDFKSPLQKVHFQFEIEFE